MVIHDKKNQRFYIEKDQIFSTLSYRIVDDHTWDYYSTFVPPELRGRSIAKELVKFALDFADKNNISVIPSCWYVDLYQQRNPSTHDYQNDSGPKTW